MATDFFQRQDHARRQTTRLLLLFGLSVAAIILVIYLVLVMGTAGAEHGRNGLRPPPQYWNPVLLAWVTLGTLLVVGLGSLYKTAELSAGGEQIALMLGGRAVNPQTTNLAERRLLNVVEEMALASGIPVPPVYVLDHEPGINAFAAGHQPGDAVVAVSAGCLSYLTREELQGVMAHEFSHILNGDMRLNLRLIGVVFGILVLAVIGYYTMRFAGAFSSGDSKKSGGAAGVFLFGLVLIVLGYVGVFFGNLIKSAISRQREFLADASAVQFTRLPSGIAGALKKIGGLADGSRIRDAHADEISHMFFGAAFAGGLFHLFATHPPLVQRIRALEPDFDGQFPDVQAVAIAVEQVSKPSRLRHSASRPLPIPVPLPLPVLGGSAAGVSGLAGVADSAGTKPLVAEEVVRHIGEPQGEHFQQASHIVADMPPPLLDAAREPYLAQALVYALILSGDDEATRAVQRKLLAEQVEPALRQQTEQLLSDVQSLAAEARLPLVSLTIPAIKQSSVQQYARFRRVVDALVHADGRVTLSEYCLRRVLFSYLDVHFGLTKPKVLRYRSVSEVRDPAIILLSSLAYAGHQQVEEAGHAFQSGIRELFPDATIAPLRQCTLQGFDAALGELAQARPTLQRLLIGAVTACIAADGKATVEERELLRAIAAVLGCPVPQTA
jgi:Zn-dependent protease with chaperone function